MLEAVGVVVVAMLTVLGGIVAVNGIRLWWMKRQWRQWGTNSKGGR